MRGRVEQIGTRMQRHLGEPNELDPGQYCTSEHESISGIELRVHVRCPCCGGVDTLGGQHEIHRSTGLVTPRWKCPTETCPYLERITLESWEAS